MQVFQGNEFALKQQFQLSAMSVVIIGLLRNRNVFLTEPLLELASSADHPLSNLLKDRSLLVAIDKPKQWEEILEKYCLNEQCPLVLLDQGSHRVLALQDEILAEVGWKKEPEKEQSLQTISSNMSLEIPDLHLNGLEHLFSKDEIIKIKLSIATAVKPEEKIEAIRKMNLSHESKQEKALLFLHALGDSQWLVRSQAAQSLLSVGVNPAIISAILLLGNSDREKQEGIYSLGILFHKASDFEKGVILQIILATLREANYRFLSIFILQTITRIIPDIPCQALTMLERILHTTIELLIVQLDELLECANDVFTQVAKKDIELFSQVLWKIAEKINSRRLLVFILAQLVSKGNLTSNELAEKVVYEFGFGDELDPVYLRLGSAIIQLGEQAIPVLLQRFSITLRATEQISILKLLSTMILEKELSVSVKNMVIQTYTKEFARIAEAVRLIVLDNRFISSPAVDENLLVEFAISALLEIQKEKFSQYIGAVKAALCRIPKPAIIAIMQTLEKQLNPIQLENITEILGDIALSLPLGSSQEFTCIQQFCYQKIQLGVVYSKILFKVLGKVATGKGISSEMSEDISEYLLSSIYASNAPYFVMEGLSWAISGESLSLETAIDVCHLFMAILDKRMPNKVSEIKQVGDSKIFVFDSRSSAYTELLPILVSGLKRLALSNNASPALLERIIDYLLKKWQSLVEYKIMWGPKNVVDLAEVLSEICSHPKTQNKDKLALANALFQKVEIFSIMEFLARTLIKQNNPCLTEISQNFSKKLIDFANNQEYHSSEDLEVIMRCIAQILLSKNAVITSQIQERLVYTLFDGLRKQIFGVGSALTALSQVAHISSSLKNEIQKRLPSKTV